MNELILYDKYGQGEWAAERDVVGGRKLAMEDHLNILTYKHEPLTLVVWPVGGC